ncbi:alkaline phosphatase family protein [Virgisporangium aurantiacum]|uniref:Alkaline phosphatase family protein n=1 Tax=Virgisporangium aurantiacum TaxID=175570 RepID=A0A8J3ZET3_9ACTN|nr:nucleotide pyrophosphatase/phosphodiesterase family protein [Virgisporangium aurantiacum]GIJ61582.1 alkaline phosphatase family protein [Virgisporangium aurantiacum]
MTLFSDVRPNYGAGSLADVLPSALAAVGVSGPDPLGLRAALGAPRRVAVLLVDGLGWHQLPIAAPHAPTLAALEGRPLTAGFPSTTPTSLVTLGTGVPPGAHGVLGFFLNVPGTDRVLSHIRWDSDPPPTTWQPVDPVFVRAVQAGIRSVVVSRPEFEGSGLTVAAYRGAEFRGATGPDEVSAAVLHALSESPRALVYAYHGDVDRTGHDFGIDSPQWREAVAGVDRLVRMIAEGLPSDAVLLVTADHGQLNIPADRRIDMADDPRLRAGVAVVAGEPRVRYLHTAPGAAPDVLAAWRTVLGPAAWVGTREEAISTGRFGPVSPSFSDRIGDVVAICHDDWVVLATGLEPAPIARMVAFHGSYTAAEMEIPLLVVRGG